MTTIAYRKGILATDKQATDNGTISKAACKATVIDGRVYAITGTLVRGLKFIDWLQSDREEDAPKLKSTVVVEMDMKTGKARFWEADFPIPVEDSFYAWGSGRDVALGAMEWGADPQNAVLCAARWDDGTGKGVQYFESQRASRKNS